MRRVALHVVIMASAILVAGAAFANNPDPANSSFDTCLGRSPVNTQAGSDAYTYSGVLRDATGLPVPGVLASRVDLEIFGACGNAVVLAPDGPSDASGTVTWGAAKLNQGGGACEGLNVAEVRVDGLQFMSLDLVASPDNDGGGTVNLVDFGFLQAGFSQGIDIFKGDLDCNGIVNLIDAGIFQSHF